MVAYIDRRSAADSTNNKLALKRIENNRTELLPSHYFCHGCQIDQFVAYLHVEPNISIYSFFLTHQKRAVTSAKWNLVNFEEWN